MTGRSMRSMCTYQDGQEESVKRDGRLSPLPTTSQPAPNQPTKTLTQIVLPFLPHFLLYCFLDSKSYRHFYHEFFNIDLFYCNHFLCITKWFLLGNICITFVCLAVCVKQDCVVRSWQAVITGLNWIPQQFLSHELFNQPTNIDAFVHYLLLNHYWINN